MEKTERIWLDGRLVAWDEAQVHVLTHSLHYGLAVFEGIRCYECHGIRVKTSSFQRFHPNTLLSKAKASGHYVNSILASYEVRRAGYDEALLLDVDGYVSEASGENVFMVAGGVAKTTPLPTVLGGITRDAVLRLLAELGIPCREERFTRDEVYLADEAFFTGTAAEVTPIRDLDDRRIGDGKPGPTTRRLQEQFFGIVRGRDDRHRSWLAYV